MTKICIIGAGAAGLCAAKHAFNEGFDVTVYEQTAELGGTWVYDPKPNCHTAMYEVLKTNLPKEVMPFRDVPFDEDLPSFMGHKEVLDYLKDFAGDMRILYEHTVEKVKREDDEWKVTVSHNSKTSASSFNAVFVCNGHHFAPHMPFDTSKFTGKLIHSHNYRRARDFTGERVVVAGAGPSGIDIALQVAEVAKEVVLLGRQAKYEKLPANIIQFPVHLLGFSGSSAVLEGLPDVQNVDSVIICTGYEMKFPFLDDGLVKLSFDNVMISPLYEHVLHVEYPDSLFFIGMNIKTVTFTLFEHQSKYALAILTGRVAVPSKEELVDWERRRLEFLKSRGQDGHFYHFLGDDQWAYFDRLAELGNFPKWERHVVMRKMYNHIFKLREESIVEYKKVEFHVDGDDFTVTRHSELHE